MGMLTMTRSGAVRHSQWPLRRAVGWLLIVVGTAAYAYAALIRPWHLRWGATDAEVAETLPGDELVREPAGATTRAVTVNAPPEAIWPWLAQLGQAKGGFYSYERLENLLGCAIHNADTVVPAWQQVQPGDLVKMAPSPDAPPAYLVASVEPGRALVLGHHVGLSPDPASPWSDTWQFVIVPVDGQTSRLIVRSRSIAGTPLLNRALEPGIFVMEQRMLRGIKERAERLAAQH
jgi:hypothetical protein